MSRKTIIATLLSVCMLIPLFTSYGTVYAVTTETQASSNDSSKGTQSANGGSSAETVVPDTQTLLDDGYYTIKSTYNTSFYLGVEDDSTNDDAAIVLRSGTVTNGMKWKIQFSSSGDFKLIPKTGESNNRVLSLNGAFTYINGIDLKQSDYTNDDSYEDEWKLSIRTVNLELLFDNAYLARYPEAYQRIINHANALQELYLKEFGIQIKFTLPTQFASYADTNCHANPFKVCDHAENEECFDSISNIDGSTILETLHHKNINNIMARIPFPDTEQSVKIAFIGHECCAVVRSGDSNDDGIMDFVSHTAGPYYGLTYIEIGLASITNFTTEEDEMKTVVHEFGHFYSAPDHYGNSQPTTDDMNEGLPNSPFDSDCIYGENRHHSDVTENLIICDGCKEEIKKNLLRFDHD